MATKTYLQLKTALSSMWGYEDPADLLAQDLADIESFINGAYFDCYAPADGTRPWWPEQYHSDIIKAAVSTNLTLTQGSKAVTGFAFEQKYAGSFVKIGEKWYRYAGNTAGPVYNLVQPWDQASGTYAATIYYNAVALPWNVIELAGVPSLLGVGLLTPLPDPDAELNLRSEPGFDFHPRDGRSTFAQTRRNFSIAAYLDTGDPRHYHIDQASVAPTFAVGNRIHFYPIPEIGYTFDLRANIVPNALSADGDTPELPAQAVDNILLPIAREKLVELSAGRRYTGPNVQLIARAADRAREQLKSLRRVQRDVAGSFRVRRGW